MKKFIVEYRAIIADIFFLVGVTPVLFYGVLLLLNSVGFMVSGSIGSSVTWLALITTLVLVVFLGIRELRLSINHVILSGIILLFLTAISLWLTSSIYDLSWDGRDYQQKAVRQLMSGWNPLTTRLEPQDAYFNIEANHYPKGPWVAAASIAKVTGDMETGKLMNLGLIQAVFFISLGYFIKKEKFPLLGALVASFLLAFNPVSIYQSMSYYIDGQVSSIFILVSILALLAIQKPSLGIYVTLIAAIIVGLNIKFTGTIYVLLILVFALMAKWLLEKSLKGWLPLFISTSIGLILGLFLVGFNPYISNLTSFGNPFYPTYGGNSLNKAAVLEGQMPSNFEGKSQVQKLFISLFSPSQNTYQSSTGNLKNPFSFTKDEIKMFSFADVRVGGWGPLFGGDLLLSGIGLVILWVSSKRIFGITLLGIALILVTALLNPEVWWARYSPQLWLVPVVIFIGMLFIPKFAFRQTGYVLAICLLANIALVSGGYFVQNYRETSRVKNRLQDIASAGKPILVYYGPLDAIVSKLDAFHISYRSVGNVEDLPCSQELASGNFYSYQECP